jgi:hypothetical protein
MECSVARGIIPGMTWQDELLRLFESAAGAAKAIHPQWQESAPDESKGGVDALANRIRKLLKGQDEPGWWSRHPKLQRVLANAVGVDQGEIFGTKKATPQDLAFPEFPRLPPLEAGEDPCWLGPRGSLLDMALDALSDDDNRPNRWITAPAGAGKSLVIRCLRSRHSGDVIAASVRRLEEIADPTVDAPLVVEIEERPGTEGIDRLLHLEHLTSPIVVLAPFPMPSELQGVGSDKELAWLPYDGSPPAGWRSRLLHWIDQRLESAPGDTKLERDAVTEWLREHDPEGRIVATPGDLLALCADFDVHGRARNPTKRAHHWLAAMGMPMLPADAPPTWKKRSADRIYRRLVVDEVRYRRKRYGSLDTEDWVTLLAEEESVGPSHSSNAVDYLLEAGLLRSDASGVIAYPRWVARAVAMDAITTEIQKNDLLGWGTLAADDSRRELMDATLDALPIDALRSLALRLADRGTPQTLEAVAELESTLAAIARRLGKDLRLRSNDERVVQDLLVLQLEALYEAQANPRLCYPYTRRYQDEWFATAWTLSLRVPAPEGVDPSKHPWLFPAWVDALTLSDVPYAFPSSSIQPLAAKTGVRRLIEMAPLIIAKLEPGPLQEDVPRLLLPAMFLDEAFHERLNTRLLRELGGTWEERILAKKLSRMPPNKVRRVASRIWALAGSDGPPRTVSVVARIHKIRQDLRTLAGLVFQALEPVEVGATARDHGLYQEHVQEPSELFFLPRAQRQAAVRGWHQRSRSDGRAFIIARELFGLFDLDDLELVVELTQASPKDLSPELAAIVWRISPPRAEAETRRALEQDLPASAGWFYAAPREHLDAIIDALEQTGRRPDWLERWAHRFVLDGGEAAERIYALAKGGGTA